MPPPSFISAALLLAATLPATAHAADCGPQEKAVQIERKGFVPDVQYICSGQVVYLYNDSGSTITLSYRDQYNRTVNVVALSHGSRTGPISNATAITNVRTIGFPLTTLSNAEIRMGTAPDAY